jgi:hypothetical protein
MALEGKVATIVSVREVAINIGQAQGVAEGMVFAILAQSPLAIKDPSTGKTLGQIDREKVRVKATEVYDKFAICRTYETYRTAGLLDPSFGTMFRSLSISQDRVRTLKVEDSELPPPLSPEESYVKVGDRVRQVVDDSPPTGER